MTQPGDSDFGALRSLLALKRHEVPPPGHHDRLAEDIIDRIESGPEPPPGTWWQRWIDEVDLKPALAGALGLVVGAFYFLGWSWSRTIEIEANAAPLSVSPPWIAANQVPFAAEVDLTSPTFWTHSPHLRSSVNPVFGAGMPRAWNHATALEGADSIRRVGFTAPQH
jgi:hypothetical protein